MESTSIIQVVNIVFEVLIWLVIVRCILSFVRHNPYQPLIRFVYDVTEPIMAPFRKLIPAAGGLDFSPIVVLLVLSLVQSMIIRLLLTIL
ncbi:MAG: YggT family protein [Syntrophomonas sp.]|nr:YggT family protein [Syntrophomonas sp.]